jgi:hypothetical protein
MARGSLPYSEVYSSKAGGLKILITLIPYQSKHADIRPLNSAICQGFPHTGSRMPADLSSLCFAAVVL